MSEQIGRGKSWVSVSQLFEKLKPEGDLRIIFDYTMNIKGNKMGVRVLSVKCNGKEIDMEQIFEIADGINVWLDCGKQLNKIKFGILRELHCIDIDSTLSKFINNKGQEISYHKINFKPVTQSEGIKNMMNRLVKELEQKEVEYVSKIQFVTPKEEQTLEQLDEDCI